MKDLLQALLSAPAPVALVRVIQSSGSAPRGPGASMIAGENGLLFGTVGGGKVEHHALALAKDVLRDGCLRTRDYALRNRDAADMGMVCGGDMRLLLQRIGPEHAPLLRDALGRIEARQPGFLLTDLNTGALSLAAERPDGPFCFAQPLLQPGVTHVFGAGHVARALAPLLISLGFRVAVLDDRPEFADPGLFPGAERVVVVDFARLDVPLGVDDDVLIMTRGHEHDLSVLAQALAAPVRYIGMMGSKSKRAFVYANLRERGFTDRDIARVHSPVGLSIGAQTPLEIAVSIAAELIQIRANHN